MEEHRLRRLEISPERGAEARQSCTIDNTVVRSPGHRQDPVGLNLGTNLVSEAREALDPTKGAKSGLGCHDSGPEHGSTDYTDIAQGYGDPTQIGGGQLVLFG